jgi:hypothetical protein
MDKITIERTGKRPLAFTGETVASTSSWEDQGVLSMRCHDIAVFRTESDKWVVRVSYWTKWNGENDYADALAFDTVSEVAALLESYKFPNAGIIGYPIGANYAERQTRMMAELTEGFQRVAGKVLAAIGAKEQV